MKRKLSSNSREMNGNPSIQGTLGLLSHLDMSELKAVLNDDERFEELIKDNSQTAKDVRNSEKEMIVVSNKSVADYNGNKWEELEGLKAEVAVVYDKIGQLNRDLDSKITQLRNIVEGATGSGTPFVSLQNVVNELDKKAEQLWENFLSGSVKLEGFLEEYPRLRKEMHTTKVKAEKLNDLMSRRITYKLPQLRQPSAYQGPAHSSPLQYQYRGYGESPYPLGGQSMPMPGIFKSNHF